MSTCDPFDLSHDFTVVEELDLKVATSSVQDSSQDDGNHNQQVKYMNNTHKESTTNSLAWPTPRKKYLSEFHKEQESGKESSKNCCLAFDMPILRPMKKRKSPSAENEERKPMKATRRGVRRKSTSPSSGSSSNTRHFISNDSPASDTTASSRGNHYSYSYSSSSDLTCPLIRYDSPVSQKEETIEVKLSYENVSSEEEAEHRRKVATIDIPVQIKTEWLDSCDTPPLRIIEDEDMDPAVHHWSIFDEAVEPRAFQNNLPSTQVIGSFVENELRMPKSEQTQGEENKSVSESGIHLSWRVVSSNMVEENSKVFSRRDPADSASETRFTVPDDYLPLKKRRCFRKSEEDCLSSPLSSFLAESNEPYQATFLNPRSKPRAVKKVIPTIVKNSLSASSSISLEDSTGLSRTSQPLSLASDEHIISDHFLSPYQQCAFMNSVFHKSTEAAEDLCGRGVDHLTESIHQAVERMPLTSDILRSMQELSSGKTERDFSSTSALGQEILHVNKKTQSVNHVSTTDYQKLPCSNIFMATVPSPSSFLKNKLSSRSHQSPLLEHCSQMQEQEQPCALNTVSITQTSPLANQYQMFGTVSPTSATYGSIYPDYSGRSGGTNFCPTSSESAPSGLYGSQNSFHSMSQSQYISPFSYAIPPHLMTSSSHTSPAFTHLASQAPSFSSDTYNVNKTAFPTWNNTLNRSLVETVGINKIPSSIRKYNSNTASVTPFSHDYGQMNILLPSNYSSPWMKSHPHFSQYMSSPTPVPWGSGHIHRQQHPNIPSQSTTPHQTFGIQQRPQLQSPQQSQQSRGLHFHGFSTVSHPLAQQAHPTLMKRQEMSGMETGSNNTGFRSIYPSTEVMGGMPHNLQTGKGISGDPFVI